MVANNIPHRQHWGGSEPKVRNGELSLVEPKLGTPRNKAGKPKKPTVSTDTKVQELVASLRAEPEERIMQGKGKWQLATTGRPISFAVIKRAYHNGLISCLDDGGLFPGYRPSKNTSKIAGQTWKLADGP
jgi:hypothetical protein